jgi:L-rhamnose mutarotase
MVPTFEAEGEEAAAVKTDPEKENKYLTQTEKIAAYERWHKAGNLMPGIKESILGAGIVQMEIYRTGNRLVMTMDTDDTFSFERKAAMDQADPNVQEWEKLMWEFQSPLPWAKEGEKWVFMDKIFQLS